MIPGATGADGNVVGAIGFGLVSDQAFGAGAASLPGPWSDPDWDGWFLWMPWSFRWEFADASGQVLGDARKTIDSKAMRKVGQNETLVVMAESQGTAAVVAVSFRLLVKLA